MLKVHQARAECFKLPTGHVLAFEVRVGVESLAVLKAEECQAKPQELGDFSHILTYLRTSFRGHCRDIFRSSCALHFEPLAVCLRELRALLWRLGEKNGCLAIGEVSQLEKCPVLTPIQIEGKLQKPTSDWPPQ